MAIFHLSQLQADLQRTERAYLEFLRVPALSAGLYSVPAGAVDAQRPHHEDEAYVVVAGRGALRVGAEDHAVEPGTVAFVGAGVEHRFHSLTEDLTALVFFAPAESAGAAPCGRVSEADGAHP
jgi:mannose-6-phosphate isomerase-like protein (cupin superfamily)